MKIVVKQEITCKNIKKYLPQCYSEMLPANFNNKGENVNIVIFPCDRKGVVTGRYIEKALQKMEGSSLLTVYFAWCFSTEAKTLIKENHGMIFEVHNFEWTDEEWFIYKNGCG